jgi:nucleoside diphosphate kinase
MESLTTYLSSNISDPMRKDHVFVIIKPGFYNLSSELFKIFAEHGYKTVKSKTKRLTLPEAKSLYKVHKKEDFYENLCKYMSSDITMAFILKKKSDNIFDEFAKLKDEIREKYGESDMRNVLHSSDSYKNFTHESQVYFYNIHQDDLTDKKSRK